MSKLSLNEVMDAEPSERLPGYQWQELRERVLRRDKDKCKHCGQSGNEVDHIIPKCLGGEDDPQNLKLYQTLCNACHKKKTAQDREKLRRINKLKKYTGSILRGI